ncbi:methyltransferase family protein [Thermosporothrix hazakensis]|jgi:ubiquinone/menaquinone biosynthesis C-methylase UbiE|uniref:Methyltransferase family protein n=1 Tax=Thermosporothrix hazakensis TaxID=644383 RepID=A0A326U5U1_THEHA|nr:class I SAM-dependent methyltransferase [Thermosporothrix hazakensis]PZW29336.1 methyltransferase family protein [Thermosporothrix hazakensis]GCE45313.1 hypothetical protein KTH_01820 [Thermosporothrix hazakensis]
MRRSKQSRTYLIDPESSAEKARLLQQGRLLTNKMGGYLPEQTDLTRFHRLLDVGCGPGEWVLDLAFEHPEFEVVGIDVSEQMIEYARTQARMQGLENTSFHVMDATQPLRFPSRSFDLVNARTIAGFMPRACWPFFINECVRILRPGGIIRLTECDQWGITNSRAFERFHQLCMKAGHNRGLGFSEGAVTLAITPMLKRFLQNIHCRSIQERPFVWNFSAGEEGHQGMYLDCVAFFQLVQPALLEQGLISGKALAKLYEQVLIEMQSETFCGITFFLTVWGEVDI